MYWQSSMADDEEVDDAEEDFYGLGLDNAAADTQAGASANETNISVPTQTVQNDPKPLNTLSLEEQRKAENQKKAELLRQKLLAQRQLTPMKTVFRSNTPAKVSNGSAVPQQMPTSVNVPAKVDDQPKQELSKDIFGLDELIKEGKAAAAAKATATQVKQQQIQTEAQSMATQPPAENKSPTAHMPAKVDNHPSQLTNVYYADLAAWLDFTGFHNQAYRASKLRTYKERKALIEEKKRIAERLETLKREEEADMAAFRAQAVHPSTDADMIDPPPLPAEMPSKDVEAVAEVANKITNGVKRAHSPAPSDKVTRQRNNTGFRIRGANDSPTNARGQNGRRNSPKPVDRRASYPNPRRSSLDGSHSRDPSLERRQSYYRQDGDRGGPADGGGGPGGYDASRYRDQYPSRDSQRFGRGAPYSTGRPGGNRYRGSAGLELPKGGVRYFIIKSWNRENVATAQRDGLWSTQLKNEERLAEAFHTSKHVILLFSVNKSMAFQGYALMTSPPDPSLPKPPFCAKLNWGTSPAFSIRWLGTTPVHFRMVGHLKNTMNPDERGEPRAVLVGKDGQEISSDAGMGVVWILDEAEAVEGGAA